jgi:hypothetical protein
MFVGQRERDRTASGADVQHARLVEALEPGEAPLHDDLGLRPGHEHTAVDGERQPPEAPLAENVREGLTCLAP